MDARGLDDAYRPQVDDGRARFPETVKAQASKGMAAAIAAVAQMENTTHAEFIRRSVLQCLKGAEKAPVRSKSANSAVSVH